MRRFLFTATVCSAIFVAGCGEFFDQIVEEYPDRASVPAELPDGATVTERSDGTVAVTSPSRAEEVVPEVAGEITESVAEPFVGEDLAKILATVVATSAAGIATWFGGKKIINRGAKNGDAVAGKAPGDEGGGAESGS